MFSINVSLLSKMCAGISDCTLEVKVCYSDLYEVIFVRSFSSCHKHYFSFLIIKSDFVFFRPW